MLTFYYGTELEKLADRLIEQLESNSLENVLAQEVLVVQNHGIGQWVSLRMAEKKGIAANLKFEFPSERIWSLIRQQNDDIPETLPSDRGPMRWTLMELFEDEKFLEEFENLRHYIEEDDLDRRLMRCWKLASRIADVFDQYLIYRPQMILDWQDSDAPVSSYAEQWQAKLWQKLIGYWKEHYEGDYLHRAELQNELWEALDQGQIKSEELPDRISVFGVSSASPAFIKTMVKLSDMTDIYFYQFSINPDITDSKNFKNPLLQSLGQEGAHFMSLFHNNTKVDFKFVGEKETVNQSLFAAVQSDLKKDHIISERNLDILSADPSIQVHNCHSPMREVEVLYNQLLDLLDKNPALSPDQILIMTPDIETYAPMIEAVFGTPDKGQPDIPYAIADRLVGYERPVTDTFLNILKLLEGRFKVTEVLDLLDRKPLQERFEFSEEELNKVEQWVADNRICWGIGGHEKKQYDLPESDRFTWRAGIRRMLLGYAMRSSNDQLYDNIFAYPEVETSDDANLAGKLSYFLTRLFDFAEKVECSCTPEEWKGLLNAVANDFLPESKDYFWEHSGIREAINEFAESAMLGGYDRKISFDIVRRWLIEQLQEQSTGGGRIGRGVTFSSLVPMRSIPFDVIGMIGMNEDAFPRSKIPIAFDLMHLNTQVGDPVQSEQDRYLFLENMLSARTHLYLSYIGQSNRQDTDFPPSVVVRELLDTIEEYYGIEAEQIVKKHPLQAYSSHYFKGGEFVSYSDTQCGISYHLTSESSRPASFMKESLPKPDEDWKHISISDLIAFFQHPAKFLLQNRLGIYLQSEEVLTNDHEPFILGGLDNYQVGQELLEQFLREHSLESYQKNLQARDILPEGWSGERAFKERVREVREFGNNVRTVLNQQPIEDLEVDLFIGDFRVVGKLSNMYEGARIDYRFGSMRSKDLIDLWICHLCLQSVKPQGHSGISRLFTRHKHKNFVEYRLGATTNYKSILTDLMDLYWQGLQDGIYFLPESTFAYAEEVCNKSNDPQKGLDKATRKWIRKYGSYPGEGEDPYNKLLYGSHNPLKEKAFGAMAEQFWVPFFNAVVEED